MTNCEPAASPLWAQHAYACCHGTRRALWLCVRGRGSRFSAAGGENLVQPQHYDWYAPIGHCEGVRCETVSAVDPADADALEGADDEEREVGDERVE